MGHVAPVWMGLLFLLVAVVANKMRSLPDVSPLERTLARQAAFISRAGISGFLLYVILAAAVAVYG